jgi:pre-mRNA-splicing helicase BRR2
MAWGMEAAAQLVVVMGTQYYDGTGLGASDYPVTDLIQMLGRASRPGIDAAGKVSLWWRWMCDEMFLGV